MEQLSARLCTLCRTETSSMQYTARRALSTSYSSSAPASSSSSSHSQAGGSSITRSGSTPSEISTLVASLRYELHRVRPEPAQVWAKLNALRDASQSHAQSSQQLLPAQPSPSFSSSPSSSSSGFTAKATTAARHQPGIPPDLLAGAIPSLLAYDTRGVRPTKTRTPSLALTALQDEAEALYARYRFLSSSMDESGAGPLPIEVMLEWAKAFERLGYAPAAWRLWKDGIASGVLSPAVQAPGRVTDAKKLADAVLLASLQWLKLCRKVEVEKRQYQSKQKGKQLGSFDFADRIAETLRETDAVLQYLTETKQQDGLSRSLRIRIVKETSASADARRAIASTYGFDFEYPSESSFLKAGASAETPAMDRHTLNTILHMYAERGDLGKMMSVFEAVAYPIKRRKFPLHRLADQYSFFSANLAEQGDADGAEADESTTASSKGFFSSSNAIDSFASAGSKELATDVAPSAGSGPITLHDHTPISTTSINTHTFVLLIETATRLGCLGVARHYLAQMLNAWKQERVTLHAAHQTLEEWDETRVVDALRKADADGSPPSTHIDQEALAALPPLADLENIPASHFGISSAAIFTVYKSLTQTGRLHANHPYLRALSAEVTAVLELLRQDVAYWAQIMDKKRILAQALAATVESGAEAGLDSARDNVGSYGTTFSSKLHLRLLKRTEIELEELSRRLELKVASLEEERTVAQLLRQLTCWQRLGDATSLAMLQGAVTEAQEWVTAHAPLLQRRRSRNALAAAQVGAGNVAGPLALLRLRGRAERPHEEHEGKMAAARGKLASKVRRVETAAAQAKGAIAHLAKERETADLREARALDEPAEPEAPAVALSGSSIAKSSEERAEASRQTSSDGSGASASGRAYAAEATVMTSGLSFS